MHCDYKTRDDARVSLFDYMEVFYNRQRRHSSISYQAPLPFEAMKSPVRCPPFQSSFCELECSEADVCDLTFERLMAEHDAFASTSLAGMAKLLGLVENRLEAMNRMADQYE